MNLNQFLSKYPYVFAARGKDIIHLFNVYLAKAEIDLFNLKDYTVSSHACEIFVIIPK